MVDKLERAYCNKCGFVGVPDGMGFHARPSDGEQCNYLCRSFTPANGEQVERVTKAISDALADEERACWEKIMPNAARAAIAAMNPTPTEDARGRVKVLEEVAEWYRSTGWMLDEDDVPDAILALGNKETDRHG